MPDKELEAIYAEANRRGLFKRDRELQAIGHELRKRKLVSDPTQGGLIAPPAPKPAPQKLSQVATKPQAEPASGGLSFGDPNDVTQDLTRKLNTGRKPRRETVAERTRRLAGELGTTEAEARQKGVGPAVKAGTERRKRAEDADTQRRVVEQHKLLQMGGQKTLTPLPAQPSLTHAKKKKKENEAVLKQRMEAQGTLLNKMVPFYDAALAERTGLGAGLARAVTGGIEGFADPANLILFGLGAPLLGAGGAARHFGAGMGALGAGQAAMNTGRLKTDPAGYAGELLGNLLLMGPDVMAMRGSAPRLSVPDLPTLATDRGLQQLSGQKPRMRVKGEARPVQETPPQAQAKTGVPFREMTRPTLKRPIPDATKPVEARKPEKQAKGQGIPLTPDTLPMLSELARRNRERDAAAQTKEVQPGRLPSAKTPTTAAGVTSVLRSAGIPAAKRNPKDKVYQSGISVTSDTSTGKRRIYVEFKDHAQTGKGEEVLQQTQDTLRQRGLNLVPVEVNGVRTGVYRVVSATDTDVPVSRQQLEKEQVRVSDAMTTGDETTRRADIIAQYPRGEEQQQQTVRREKITNELKAQSKSQELLEASRTQPAPASPPPTDAQARMQALAQKVTESSRKQETVTPVTTSRFDLAAEESALFETKPGTQSKTMREGVTREQGQRFYARKQAAEAADKLKYQGNETARSVIDRLLSEGGTPKKTPGGIAIVRTDGSEVPFRRKVEMDYIKAATNEGPFARNYGDAPKPAPSAGEFKRSTPKHDTPERAALQEESESISNRLNDLNNQHKELLAQARRLKSEKSKQENMAKRDALQKQARPLEARRQAIYETLKKARQEDKIEAAPDEAARLLAMMDADPDGANAVTYLDKAQAIINAEVDRQGFSPKDREQVIRFVTGEVSQGQPVAEAVRRQVERQKLIDQMRGMEHLPAQEYTESRIRQGDPAVTLESLQKQNEQGRQTAERQKQEAEAKRAFEAKQAETKQRLEALSASIAEEVKPNPQEVEGLRASSSSEKLRPATGLTPAQETYLAGRLKFVAKRLAEGDAENQTVGKIRIEIPGDGSYAVSSIQQANNLHMAITGEPIFPHLKPDVKKATPKIPQEEKLGYRGEEIRRETQARIKQTLAQYEEINKKAFLGKEEDVAPPDWVQRLAQAEQNVTDKLKAKSKKRGLQAGVDPEDFALLAELGAVKLARGTLSFAEWSKQIVEEVRASVADDYAESLKPHLAKLYEDAKKIQADKYALPNPPAEDDAQEPPVTTPRAPEKAETPQQAETPAPAQKPLTGAKNATTETERAERGQSPIDRQAYTLIGDAYARGKDAVTNGRIDPRAMAKSVTEKPRPLSAEEVGALAYDRAQIIKEYDATTAELSKAVDANNPPRIADLQAKQERLLADLDTNDAALVKGGREQSAAFNARKMMVGQDFSFAGIQQQAKAAKGAQLTSDEKQKFEALTTRLKDAESRLVAAENALKAEQAKTPVERQNKAAQGLPKFNLNESERARIEAAKQRFLQKTSRASSGVDPSILSDVVEIGTVYVQAGMRNLSEWRAQMKADLPGVDEDTLNEAWRNIATNAKREKRLTGQIQDFTSRIQQGNFTLPQRPKPAAPSAEVKQLQAQRDMLRAQIQREIDRMRPKTVGRIASDVASVPRSLLTSFDLSAPLRQGSVLSLSNPRLAVKNIAPMLRAFAREEAAQIVENDIRSRPNAARYEESGLYLAPLNEQSRLSRREEAFMSTLAEKFPGVRASERAYITYLNKLRADAFDMFEKALPNAKPEELNAVADFINTATGRGKLGATGERAATLLNNIFFSPRYLTSRVQLLAGEPFWNQSARGSGTRARKLIARTYLQYAGAVLAIVQLAKAGGAEVETDSRHTDFLKIKVGGNKVFDVLAGLQQAGTYLSRMATGKRISPGGHETDLDNPGFKGDTRKELTEDFLRGKLAPVPGSAVNLMAGQNIVGQPATLKTEAARLLIPMSWPDVYAAAKEEGMPTASAVFLMSLFGVGAQYRGKQEQKAGRSGGGLPKAPSLPGMKGLPKL